MRTNNFTSHGIEVVYSDLTAGKTIERGQAPSDHISCKMTVTNVGQMKIAFLNVHTYQILRCYEPSGDEKRRSDVFDLKNITIDNLSPTKSATITHVATDANLQNFKLLAPTRHPARPAKYFEGTLKLLEIGVYELSGKFVNGESFYVKNGSFRFPAEGGSCFPDGTPVLTPFGERAIETFKKGDIVLSWNENKRAFFKRAVKRVDHHATQPVAAVIFENTAEPLLVTLNHTLATNNGWKTVGQLQQHDALWVANKETGLLSLNKVLSVGDSGKILPVHNLIIEGEHNFIAGGVVAHSFTFARTLRSALHTACEKTAGLLTGQTQAKPAYVFGG